MSRWIEPVTLKGEFVTLEPVSLAHCEGLAKAARDGELWKLWYTSVPHPDRVETYVTTALQWHEAIDALTFVARRKEDGEIVGSTRYFNVDSNNRRLEIGYTWYATSAQRTAINTEAKLLLLAHAFDQLKCIAVEFRTHWMNHASRNAILRLGAKQDGVLRHHQIGADGTLRDTVVFSIVAPEWPTVRHHLKFKLNRLPC